MKQRHDVRAAASHRVLRWAFRSSTLLAGLLAGGTAAAANFSITDRLLLQVNTNIVAGASWRISERADDLVGKSNLDPNVCAGINQSCQGLHRLQTHPAEALANARGAPTVNADDGNLNYDRGDVVQAPFRINQDFNLQWGNFGIFGRWLWFYDFQNASFTETAPNRITPENVDEVAVTGDQVVSNRYLDTVFSAGGPVRFKRRNGRTLEQVGTDFQLLDLNFYGSFPVKMPLIGERELIFRLGRQTVSWGESTVLVINSVNQANPANVNNLFRTGFTLDEVFTPVGMAFASMNITDNISVEAYYQYEWDAVEIPPQGSFFSFFDFGLPDIGDKPQSDRLPPSAFNGEPRIPVEEQDNIVGSFNASFGGAAEDPFFLGSPLDNPLSTLTPTTASIPRLPDDEAKNQGQWGVATKFFLPDLNFGTELAFYAMNYHSKLPYASVFSADASCARPEGNPNGITPTNTIQFLQACDNVPLVFNQRGVLQLVAADAVSLALQRPGVLAELGVPDAANLAALIPALSGDPNDEIDSIINFDSLRLQLEFPENLKMFGFSFNTPAGPDYSMQGEVSFRPKLPLQVSPTDVVFAGLGPTLSNCHIESVGCAGASAGEGFNAEGERVIFDQNNFVDENGDNPFPDTINLVVGALPGVARSFPNFILPFRGQEIGSNAPNSFIRGWEPFKVLQYNIGATRLYGASEQPFADQIIMLYEVGATHVLGFPEFDELQIAGPDVLTTSATAGADGSGADGSRQACSTNPACSVGPDGARFNPFQAQRDQFANRFSWGYRIVAIVRWDSVLPGWSIEPTLIWGHDINGNAPGPGGNFVEGRKTLNSTFQFRYKTSLSFNVAYQLFTGGGSNHVLRDRDNLGFFVRYQF